MNLLITPKKHERGALEQIADTEDSKGELSGSMVDIEHGEQRPLADSVHSKGAEDSSASPSLFSSKGLLQLGQWRSAAVIITFIIILGVASSAAFLSVGISNAKREEESSFRRAAQDTVNKIDVQFRAYVKAAAMVHNYCRQRDFTRADFRALYEYLVADSLEFKAVQFDPNVTREERQAYEDEAEEYYATHYPHIDYRGFVGFETEIPSGLEPRSQQDFYFPIHYMEPIPGNEAAIDLDYYSHVSRRQTLEYCMANGLPALTDRLVLVKTEDETTRCGAGGEASYGVVLMHPGVQLSNDTEVWPRDLSSIVICIPSLLQGSVGDDSPDKAVYVYDASDSSGSILFLGGGKVVHRDFVFLPERSLEGVMDTRNLVFETDIEVTNKKWKIVVVAEGDSYSPNLTFIILGAVIVFVASICLALWVYSSTRRLLKINQMRSEAEAEKAALILENAREATRAERELNDFIGHEVRNPVSAAMAACSFVKTAISKPQPLSDEESINAVRGDVDIIDSSLRFVNDLLRNMLDMHRAANKQLKVNMSPTDVLHDVMEPVRGMLHQRSGSIQFEIDCPPDLFMMTDHLRLKQVLMNLGRNSSKFVTVGFIRLRAAIVDGSIQLAVEDSGSGIPADKRPFIFSKFQESLDVLSQGTGIGLFLCKTLVEQMGGDIYLDEHYDSGVEGHRGTRFILDMHTEPLPVPSDVDAPESAPPRLSGVERTTSLSTQTGLPEVMSVLFVDDDRILRKLFARTIKTVAPKWKFREAASGEAALVLLETEEFDIVFMDMYMASVEKQLLGSETVREMRSRGVSCRVCGLSANDKEDEFLSAGADAFAFKPFPCEPKALKRELLRILYDGFDDDTFDA